MSVLLHNSAKKIPDDIRKTILEEGFIDKAINTEITGTPMEFLFDVFVDFLDPAKEFNDWYCVKCRGYILTQWRLLKPHLEKLQWKDNVQQQNLKP